MKGRTTHHTSIIAQLTQQIANFDKIANYMEIVTEYAIMPKD